MASGANNGGCNATEAFIDLSLNAGAEVINMSLGGLSPFNDGYGVQETMINRLTSLKNVLFADAWFAAQYAFFISRLLTTVTWSITGVSGASVGENSVRRPSVRGIHCAISDPIGM